MNADLDAWVKFSAAALSPLVADLVKRHGEEFSSEQLRKVTEGAAEIADQMMASYHDAKDEIASDDEDPT